MDQRINRWKHHCMTKCTCAARFVFYSLILAFTYCILYFFDLIILLTNSLLAQLFRVTSFVSRISDYELQYNLSAARVKFIRATISNITNFIIHKSNSNYNKLCQTSLTFFLLSYFSDGHYQRGRKSLAKANA